MKHLAMVPAVCLLVSSSALADPPPFGTELGRWELHMSGGYSAAGMTWVRDSGKFFVVDQGYSGLAGAWKFEPADPVGTIERVVEWIVPNLGDTATDIPWGIAWDSDSGCFWVSQILDGNIYGGCYLLRYVWNGSNWVWGGAPRDSWYVGDGGTGGGLECMWSSGMDRNVLTGVYYFAPVAPSPNPLNRIGRFDPYTKTNLGRLQHGCATSVRACALIPWDSAYILTWDWDSGLVKLDTTGLIVQAVPPGGFGPADFALHCPRAIQPEDTVCFYRVNSHSRNILQRISTGMLWSQLGSVGVQDQSPEPRTTALTATLVRDVLMLPPDVGTLKAGTLERASRPELLDASGRVVMQLALGANNIQNLCPGVYCVRVTSGEFPAARKVIKLE